MAVTVWQLKYIAEAFYTRFNELGYTGSVPWTVTTADDGDYDAVNIGQVKALFDFEITY